MGNGAHMLKGAGDAATSMSLRARNHPHQGRRVQPARAPEQLRLNASALRTSAIASSRATHLRHSPGLTLLSTLRHTRRERHVRVRLRAVPTLRAVGRLGLGNRRWVRVV